MPQIESYLARKPITVGDEVRQPGEPVPEAEGWRRPQAWVASGHLALTFREVSDEEYAAILAGVPFVVDGGADEEGVDLVDLKVDDLRALAKERGLTGFSKWKKDKLVAALTG